MGETVFCSDHVLIRTPLSLHVLVASARRSSKISRMDRSGLLDSDFQTQGKQKVVATNWVVSGRQVTAIC